MNFGYFGGGMKGALEVKGDCRLDNRDGLFDLLGLPSGLSNLELVEHAWAQWGAETPSKLLGDFGLSIFDAATETLWLFRDGMGVVPLYYALSEGRCFASNALDDLIHHDQVPRALDEDVLGEWCLRGHVFDTSRTFYRAIKKCPRATLLKIRHGVILEEKAYWSPEAVKPVVYPRPEDYVDHLQTLLEQVVRDRVVAGELQAAHASGGLDSTPIAVIAGRACLQKGEAFHTFNWCSPDAGDDPDWHEWSDARWVAEQEGFCHHEIRLDAAALKHIFLTHNLASDGTTMFEYEARLVAEGRALGVKRIFSGFGGDEFLTSRARDQHDERLRAGHIGEVLRRLRQEVAPSVAGWRLMLDIGKTTWRACFPLAWNQTPRHLADQARMEARLAFIQPDFAAHLRGMNQGMQGEGLATIKAKQRHMLSLGYHQERMESWYILGRRAGISYVYPFLDKRILEFAFALPAELYFKEGRSRYLYDLAIRRWLGPRLHQKAKLPESRRVMQLQRETRAALSDPMVIEHVARATSPYINVQKLVEACRTLSRGAVSGEFRPAINSRLAPVASAVLALNIDVRSSS